MNRLWYALPLLAVFGLGCGPGDTHPPSPVTGTVTLDGKPLNEGEIGFFPQDGSGPLLGRVKGGAFQFDAPAGVNRVEVRSYRVTKLPAPDVCGRTERKQNVLPERYGQHSKLTAEVKAGGANRFEFQLTSR